jgi:trehalose utilization protein
MHESGVMSTSDAATQPLRLLVWNEGVHESTGRPANIGEYYPRGIGGAVAEGLAENLPDAIVSNATLADPEHGLTEEALAATDVLFWWGHIAHDRVDDEIVERVQRHVLGGMGLVVLHSAHFSKIFKKLMGTTCSLQWRNDGEQELVWTIRPEHPIAEGVPSPIVVPRQEMYGERFDVPHEDELIFVSAFAGGEIFRSGLTFTRGKGRIFYFSPGDQEYPVYLQPEIRRVLSNSARWAAQPGLARHEPSVSEATQVPWEA